MVRISKILDFHSKTHLFFTLRRHLNPKKMSRSSRHVVQCVGGEPMHQGLRSGHGSTCSNHFWGEGRSLKTGCRFTLKLSFSSSSKAPTTPASHQTLLTTRVQRGSQTQASEVGDGALNQLQHLLQRKEEEEPENAV